MRRNAHLVIMLVEGILNKNLNMLSHADVRGEGGLVCIEGGWGFAWTEGILGD